MAYGVAAPHGATTFIDPRELRGVPTPWPQRDLNPQPPVWSQRPSNTCHGPGLSPRAEGFELDPSLFRSVMRLRRLTPRALRALHSLSQVISPDHMLSAQHLLPRAFPLDRSQALCAVVHYDGGDGAASGGTPSGPQRTLSPDLSFTSGARLTCCTGAAPDATSHFTPTSLGTIASTKYSACTSRVFECWCSVTSPLIRFQSPAVKRQDFETVKIQGRTSNTVSLEGESDTVSRYM